MRKRQTIVIVVLLCIIFFETIVLSYLKSQLYENTYKQALIDDQILEQKGENDALRKELLEGQSFTRLSDRAKEAGLVPARVQFLLP